MTQILLILEVILMAIIVIFVMLQKSASMGLGAYSGSNESMFGAKGPTGFLAKGTLILGLAFVINTLALGYLYNKLESRSILDSRDIATIAPKTDSEIPKASSKQVLPTAPTAPSAPVSTDTTAK